MRFGDLVPVLNCSDLGAAMFRAAPVPSYSASRCPPGGSPGVEAEPLAAAEPVPLGGAASQADQSCKARVAGG